MRKKWASLFLTFFGILDFITLFRGYRFPVEALAGRYQWDFLTFLTLAFYLSLIFSGLVFIRQMRSLYFLYYIQFPVRFLLAVFSFGFLAPLITPLSQQGSLPALAVCGFLEVGRLFVTIMAQKR